MAAILSVLLCLALIGADQFIKYLVVEYLKPIEYFNVIDGVLRFRYIENTGAVFGSFATHTVLLTILSIVLLVFTIYFLITNKSKSRLVNFCLLLMISGGVGNIIDRIRLQYVVDYIEPLFVNFAVFNFADCLITIGAFVLIIYLVVDLIKDIKKTKPESDNADDSSDDAVEEKASRFTRKRKVKKAVVEGDKEAVIFNAVIDGESPETALNDIKLGIDKGKNEPEVSSSTDDVAAEEEPTIVSLAEKNSGISAGAQAIEKADEAVKQADEILNAAKDIESSIEIVKRQAEELSAFVDSEKQNDSVISEDTVDSSVNESDDVEAIEGKSKKISIDSIDDIDFSLFE